MKLQNKKTGEIKDICEVLDMKQEDGVLYKYCSLDELNEEWQDYEEPKEIQGFTTQGEDIIIRMGSIEEAEKAVEKLEAWTRLKDKGFRFDEYDATNRAGDNAICGKVYFKGGNYDIEEIRKDLDLLFGGEDA